LQKQNGFLSVRHTVYEGILMNRKASGSWSVPASPFGFCSAEATAPFA